MTTDVIRTALEALGAREGVLGCALVELDTGMVWHASGSIDSLTELASASSDHWRLHRRIQPHFGVLDVLRTITLSHARGQITVCECGRGMLLVTLTSLPATVDRMQWRADQLAISQLVNRF